jgi:alkanesulfonate monooxygenase SsuD/methylene tetrahydromethanopterin reductase-like flavin-dependent oxidoreductase (luciferase family)
MPVTVPQGQEGRLGHFAKLAEDSGFDDIWIPDHTVFPAVSFSDPFVAAASCIAATTSIGVCFGVLQVGLRHPVALARAVSSVAAAGDGRVLLGLGVGGDYVPEWRALGVPIEQRIARFEESLPAIAALVNGLPFAHEGEHYSFSVPALRPAPTQPVPIWIGARKPNLLRHSIRFDGWLALHRPPKSFAHEVRVMRDSTGDATEPAAGIALLVSVTGTLAQARARGGAVLRKTYGTAAEAAERVVVAGLGQLGERIQEYEEAGAMRICLLVVDDSEVAWPLIQEHILASR